MIAAIALAAAAAVPPVPTDYVTDTAHVLSTAAMDSIRQELQSYYDATGNRIIVYIGQTTGETPLEDWTVDAAQKWKIRAGADKAGKDNAAVLFAFMQDHKVRIEVGYGLEPKLTDADSSRIIRETIVPKMRSGDVDGAIQGGVDGMVLTITPDFKDKIGHQVAQPSEDDGTSTAIAMLIIFLIFGALFVLFIGSLFNRRWRSAWYWGGGGWSSGGGGWSSGGGGIGGGFSGAGFGGGGASGSWERRLRLQLSSTSSSAGMRFSWRRPARGAGCRCASARLQRCDASFAGGTRCGIDRASRSRSRASRWRCPH